MEEFSDYAEGSVAIKINGKDVKIIPTMRDAFIFKPLLDKALKECDEKAMERIENIIVDMIKRANPNDNSENIKKAVALNLADIELEIMFALKILDRKDYETAVTDAKKKKTEQKSQ